MRITTLALALAVAVALTLTLAATLALTPTYPSYTTLKLNDLAEVTKFWL